jgi:hypothetical protein
MSKGVVDQSLCRTPRSSGAGLVAYLGARGHGLRRFERIAFDASDLNAIVDICPRFDDFLGFHFSAGCNDYDNQHTDT